MKYGSSTTIRPGTVLVPPSRSQVWIGIRIGQIQMGFEHWEGNVRGDHQGTESGGWQGELAMD